MGLDLEPGYRPRFMDRGLAAPAMPKMAMMTPPLPIALHWETPIEQNKRRQQIQYKIR